MDYFSRYIEIAKLKSLSSQHVINHLKSIFARHGIPDIFHSDNGPQYISENFKQFAASNGFKHVTSSPRYAQANGLAERSVQTIKKILKKADDPYMALLSYRTTPLHNGYCPSELLMGRKLQNSLPVQPSALIPNLPKFRDIKTREFQYKKKQMQNYNRRHRARNLRNLRERDNVWVKDQKKSGVIISGSNTPRSYNVKTDLGILRRHLVPVPAKNEVEQTHQECPETPPPMSQSINLPINKLPLDNNANNYVTRNGRVSKPPVRLDL